MNKKNITKSIIISLVIVGLSSSTNALAEPKEKNCFVDKNGNTICENEIAEGCYFDFDELEVKCHAEPLNGKCEVVPVC